MFQNGQRVCFRSGGDTARIQRVQLAVGKDRHRYPRVIPTNDLNATQVQVVTGGDPDRYPIINQLEFFVGTPAAWFRKGVGQTVTGAGVSQWDDQSGNARHLKQGTDTNRPALQADGTILFDGVDNFLKCDAFTLNQPETVYLLFKQVSWTLNAYIIAGDAVGNGVIYQSATTPKFRLNAGADLNESSDLAVGVYGVLAFVVNGASSLTQVNLGTPVTGNAGAGNLGGLTLGSSPAGNAAWSNIQVAEVIIFAAAHDATQRARVIHYLAGIGGVA